MRRVVLFFALMLMLTACSGFPLPGAPAQPAPTNPPPQIAPTATPQVVRTLPPLITPTQPQSPEAATPESSPAPSAPAPSPTPAFVLQAGSPAYLPAFTHPEAGCAWVGIAGQVFNSAGLPQDNIVVVVKGLFNGKAVDALALSGLAKAYGAGGYEIQVGTASATTSEALTIQLLNDKFEPLSPVYPVQTFDDCQKNLILMNFQSTENQFWLYLPAILNETSEAP
ncbi:hypothetical protein [Anaerolinea thermophila]|uniref:LytR/CpsA/Psr regulator C-terminal domain-containing protein n=2 Tax=Anaerolinea TaxID=233189 RepID=E8N202_ANATU|nr:hypothetical protein [Anaerolinea thermophila]BAJ64949.1 hypothetical protein ANT_29230 [Anaerolinea thermophila UNI-1]